MSTEPQHEDQVTDSNHGQDLQDLQDQEGQHDQKVTAGKPITLVVGERRFTTYASTLTEQSGFFKNLLLNPHWARPQDDGSYFVDQDGTIFAYILSYLRSRTLPIFYNSHSGHDYGMYHAVLGQAQYFQIDRLTKWLLNKQYEKAITFEFSVQTFEDPQKWTVGIRSPSWSSDLQKDYHTNWKTKKVYVCPRSVSRHRDNRAGCGVKCREAQGDAEDKYEEEDVLTLVEVSKKTIFKTNNRA